MQHYRLYTYDLWGNDEDGYEVNDVYRSTKIELDPVNMTDSEILDVMIKEEIFESIQNVEIAISSDDEVWYFVTKDQGKPLCELRLED